MTVDHDQAASILYPGSDTPPAAAPAPAPATSKADPADVLYPKDAPEDVDANTSETDTEAPETAPEAYEAVVLPEGMDVDEATSQSFFELAGSQGFTSDQAQALVNFQSELVERQNQAWSETLKGWEKETRNDDLVGGHRINDTYRSAKTLVETYGDEGLGDLFDHYGLNHHPLVMRFLSRVSDELR